MTANPQSPPTTNLVTVTINEREVQVPKGMLLVEAAKQVGIEIPIFCYHPKLKPVGACRMCLVEIEKMPRLQTACTTPAADGMIVRTNTKQVVDAQNGIIELLLANHPLDCPICDKGGECPLQDNSFAYGLGTSRFGEPKRHQDKAFPLSDRIVLDKERCIMCLRCVRFQAEIPGDESLKLVSRGGMSEVGVLPGEEFDSPFSGNTIEICPVGALTSRQYRFKARPWDLTRNPSVCVGCAVGCNIEVHSRDGRILRLVARENRQVDDGWLCDYGRFDTLPMSPFEQNTRVRQPLVRDGEALRPATWDDALDRAAKVLSSGTSGVVAYSALTNEAYWLLANALLPRLSGEPAGAGISSAASLWPHPVADWPVEGDIPNLAGCKSILLVGLDPWRELPVLALWIRKATQRGGKLVVIDETNGLSRDTAHWLRAPRGEEPAVVEALLRALNGETTAVAEPVRLAASALGGRPAAVLVGTHLARDKAVLGTLRALAVQIGAEPAAGGMRGSPGLGANARGALEVARDLALADPAGVLAANPSALLLVGDARWPDVGAARVVQLTSGEPLTLERATAHGQDGQTPPLHPNLEVVLPLAHRYEQGGSVTNLAGRVQRLAQAGLMPRMARPDWAAVSALAQALGAQAPYELAEIRAAMGSSVG
jgi:NADH-quinone oxidoreductase subunit G